MGSLSWARRSAPAWTHAEADGYASPTASSGAAAAAPGAGRRRGWRGGNAVAAEHVEQRTHLLLEFAEAGPRVVVHRRRGCRRSSRRGRGYCGRGWCRGGRRLAGMDASRQVGRSEYFETRSFPAAENGALTANSTSPLSAVSLFSKPDSTGPSGGGAHPHWMALVSTTATATRRIRLKARIPESGQLHPSSSIAMRGARTLAIDNGDCRPERYRISAVTRQR